MLRSAAKNQDSVTVVCDPADYGAVLAALDGEPAAAGGLPALRRRLALKVFQRTAAYDAAIARYLAAAESPEEPDLDALAGFPPRWPCPGPRRRRCATGKIRISARRSTAPFTSISSSCRARSSAITTSSISPRLPA